MQSTERQLLPYAPPSNVISLVHRFRERSLPGKVDVPLLVDVGISEGNAHRVLHALRFLGLLDDDGHPTNNFEALQIASDEEYRELLAGFVRAAYAEVLAIVDPSRDQLDTITNHFRRYLPTSQRGRQVTLFLGLCREAGIPLLDAPRERRTRRPIVGTVPRRGEKRAGDQVPSTPRAKTVSAAIAPIGDLRTQYVQSLLEAVRHIGARGEVPPTDLLDRIEKLLSGERQIQHVVPVSQGGPSDAENVSELDANEP
jgi:hypothetical protein